MAVLRSNPSLAQTPVRGAPGLRGEKGAKGLKGDQGPKGVKGVAGVNCYDSGSQKQLYTNYKPKKSVLSCQGPQGPKGDRGRHGRTGIPKGAVMSFNLESCPKGWDPLVDAQGRAIVGLPADGTLAGTVGAPLTDLEDRAHTHDVDPASVNSGNGGDHGHAIGTLATILAGGHSHTTTGAVSGDVVANVHDAVPTGDTPGPSAGHTHTGTTSPEADHTHDLSGTVADAAGHVHPVDVANTESDAATTADVIPYIQLLTCEKVGY